MVNNLSISEIKEMVALGATITNDGRIIAPEPEPVTETSMEEEIEEPEPVVQSVADGEGTEPQRSEESEEDYSNRGEEETVPTEEITKKQVHKNNSSPILPIAIAAVVAIAGGFLVRSRKKNSNRNKEDK